MTRAVCTVPCLARDYMLCLGLGYRRLQGLLVCPHSSPQVHSPQSLEGQQGPGLHCCPPQSHLSCLLPSPPTCVVTEAHRVPGAAHRCVSVCHRHSMCPLCCSASATHAKLVSRNGAHKAFSGARNLAGHLAWVPRLSRLPTSHYVTNGYLIICLLQWGLKGKG